MALTAMYRLLRRCCVRPVEVGVLHLSPSLLDRSKSMKTELMAMVETDAYVDLGGVDHSGASGGAVSVLLSCISWVQSECWDGRWGVAVCSHDQVAPTGLPLSSTSAAAVLVGQGTPLLVCNVGEHALEQPQFVSLLRMAPLPDEKLHKQHEAQATVHIGRGEACRWSTIRAVERVSAAQTSLSLSLLPVPNLRLTLLTDDCTLCTRSSLPATRVSRMHFTPKTPHYYCGRKHGRRSTRRRLRQCVHGMLQGLVALAGSRGREAHRQRTHTTCSRGRRQRQMAWQDEGMALWSCLQWSIPCQDGVLLRRARCQPRPCSQWDLIPNRLQYCSR